jgi:hypothetical protein
MSLNCHRGEGRGSRVEVNCNFVELWIADFSRQAPGLQLVQNQRPLLRPSTFDLRP